MTKPQRNIILAGLIVIAVLSLFPPWWNVTRGWGYGRHIIFSAPFEYASIDLARLVAEVLLVAAVCAALSLLWKRGS